MSDFKELVKYCKKASELDPWVLKRGLAGYCEELNDEAQEVIEAMNNNDFKNLKEEAGDVLHDWIMLCLIAEKQGLFTMEDAMDEVLEKMQRRRPYIKENKKVSLDEARKIWKMVKQEEKERKNG